MQILKTRGAAIAGLSLCVGFGALTGCNSGGGGGGTIGSSGGGGGDTLATVGSSKVTRGDLDKFLESQQGEQALPYLIDTQLIFEDLKSKGLDVTDAEVDADLERRKATDPSVNDMITKGGAKLDVAKAQIKRDLAVQKILSADVKVDDAKVKAFFTQNAKYYDTPATMGVGVLLASTKTRADLLASQLTKKTKTLAQLVAEQKQTNDPVAQQSKESESFAAFPPPISTRIGPLLAKLPKGGSTPVQQFAPQAFAIFVVTDRKPAVKADLTKIRPEVETDYKMAEVAKTVVGANPGNPPFTETLARTQQFMQSQNPTGSAPKLRDVLNYINQTKAQNLLGTLRTGGTVQVDDPTYAPIAEQYRAAAAAPGLGAGTGTGNTASSNAPAANTTSNSAPTKP